MGVRITKCGIEGVKEFLISERLTAFSVFLGDKFGDAHQAGLLDDGAEIGQSLFQNGHHVLLAPFKTQIGKVANRQCANIGVGGVRVLGEGVDGHSGKIRIVMTVEAQVKEDELFLYNVFGA